MALFPSAAGKPLFPSATPSTSSNNASEAGSSDTHQQAWLQNPSFSREQADEIQRLFVPESAPVSSATARSNQLQRKRNELSVEEHYSPSSDSDDYTRPKAVKHEGERKKHRKCHRKRDEEKEKRHKKRRKDDAESKEGSLSVKPRTIWLDESGLDVKDAYRMDSKPDANNLRYAGLYSGDIAAYRRNFGTHCLGLGSHQAIEWTDGRTKSSKKKEGKKDKPLRYFRGSEASSLLNLRSDVLLQFTHRQTGLKTDVPPLLQVKEFLPLVDEENEEDTEKMAASALTPETYITQCTAEYNRALLENPHDVPLWLEFIAFQDEALVWGRLPTSGISAEEPPSVSLGKKKGRLALSERKLAIYERALESNPLSVDLLVGHMALVQEVWETEKVVRRWKDLVFKQPNKSQLWMSYLEFCQSRFSSFTTSSLTALYTKALSTLSSIQDGRLKSHRPDPDTPSALLAIFVLYCNFLRQVGHCEKAVACFQALIEFNLCPPAELLPTEDGPTLKERMEFFEAFWDSGVPRFGEEGAAGWTSWMEATKRPSETITQPKLGAVDSSVYKKVAEVGAVDSDGDVDEVDPEVALIAGLPLRTAWLVLEQRREREGGLPWRPDPAKGESEDDCTDPDRLILFDDVSSSVFSFIDSNLHLQLLLSFLHFLGAPLPSLPTVPALPHLSYTSIEGPTEVFSTPTTILESLLSIDSLCSLPTTHQLLSFGRGHDLLEDRSLAQLVTQPSMSEQESKASGFISNVCNQAISLLRDDKNGQTAIAQVWIHHELSLLSNYLRVVSSSKSLDKAVRSKVKSVQKLIKALLRLEAHRNNLSLWNCCALLEYLVGNYNEAVRLYESVLIQFKSGPESSVELLRVCACFCGCLLGLEQPLVPIPRDRPNSKLPLHALVCLAEGSYQVVSSGELTIPPGRLLKAKAVYEKVASPTVQDCLRQTNWEICRAYFKYLTKGLEFACENLDRYTHSLTDTLSTKLPEEKSLIQEGLCAALKFQSRLIVHHSLTHPIRPAMLRETLERSLALFPSDGWFLAAYVSCEQQSFISGKLRRYFDSHAPKALTPLPWLYAVWAELQRYDRLRSLVATGSVGGGEASNEPETGTLHRIGGLLKRAAESSSGQHCPLVWRLLMKFEKEYHGLPEAKAIFYQAIERCPWVKVLYVDAVEYFPAEMERVMEVLEEKELRVRAPLEEVKLLLEAGQNT